MSIRLGSFVWMHTEGKEECHFGKATGCMLRKNLGKYWGLRNFNWVLWGDQSGKLRCQIRRTSNLKFWKF